MTHVINSCMSRRLWFNFIGDVMFMHTDSRKNYIECDNCKSHWHFPTRTTAPQSRLRCSPLSMQVIISTHVITICHMIILSHLRICKRMQMHMPYAIAYDICNMQDYG